MESQEHMQGDVGMEIHVVWGNQENIMWFKIKIDYSNENREHLAGALIIACLKKLQTSQGKENIIQPYLPNAHLVLYSA